MADGDQRLSAIFKTTAVPNERLSREKGRPIFDDMEIVEIRFPGDRQKVSVFPAHAQSANVDVGDGTSVPQTYAERFSEQYKQFKKNKVQAKAGTPLEELTFLTASQRSELKALNIYTAETLADLEGGPEIKALGMHGRDLKNQARAYIEHAAQHSEPVRLAAENEELKRQIAELQASAKKPAATPRKAEAEEPEKPAATSDFDTWDDDDLKEWIKSESGAAPRGNPSHETLVRMAGELVSEKRSK